MRPSVGRIVHYAAHMPPGSEHATRCWAAIITDVGDPGDEQVDLAVLDPTGISFDLAIDHSEDENQAGTWHWPERADG